MTIPSLVFDPVAVHGLAALAELLQTRLGVR